MTSLTDFVRKHDYLVCVDSDGCAIDTMDIKHIECFGPCMVASWGLQKWEYAILQRWNDINLYTITRGINRFKGLEKALVEINDTYVNIEDLPALTHWVHNAQELSNASLEKAIVSTSSPILIKTLGWSKKVNMQIDALPASTKKAFSGVKEALSFAHENADVSIVSSANLAAVLEEWHANDLLKTVDIVCAQDVGSKEFILQELCKKGYDKDKVLMCGDANGDMQAAKVNDVCFYPILVKHEEQSWRGFNEALTHIKNGTFKADFQHQCNTAFIDNLK